MSSQKLRIFISSVQKELENERLTVLALVTTDSFLLAHCDAVLYEHAPASPEKSVEECLKLLDTCDVCLCIVGKEYGRHDNDTISITHREYRQAKQHNIPLLIFIKGEGAIARDESTQKWIEEIRTDDFKYKRFGNILNLQHEVRNSLLKLLKDRFDISPTADQETISEQTIEAVSAFETQAIKRLSWKHLDHNIARHIAAKSEGNDEAHFSVNQLLESMMIRGLVWADTDSGEYFGTAAGIVLLGKDPSAVFPQVRFLMDAYRGVEPDGNPLDHEDVRGPMPAAIERVLVFIDRNTRHPMKIVGLDRVRLDEYPSEALREALVNAAAHRNYEDAGRKIMVEVFPDRIVVSSPGLPPKPLTIKKLLAGRYKPCSRNPIIAQSLSYFHRIEERGSGFKRMRAYMMDHGLEEPILTEDTGYFQVVFKGPGKDIGKLKVSASSVKKIIPELIEKKLNDRQRKIIARVLREGTVNTSWVVDTLKIARDTARREFSTLVELGIFNTVGEGRSTRYVLKQKEKNDR
jgi:predicted HTH transcriptional regulator